MLLILLKFTQSNASYIFNQFLANQFYGQKIGNALSLTFSFKVFLEDTEYWLIHYIGRNRLKNMWNILKNKMLIKNFYDLLSQHSCFYSILSVSTSNSIRNKLFTSFTLYPFLALVSMNSAFNSTAFFFPSSVEICLKTWIKQL